MLRPNSTPFFVDNQLALCVANNTSRTKRRKYIDLRHHLLSHHARKGHIEG